MWASDCEPTKAPKEWCTPTPKKMIWISLCSCKITLFVQDCSSWRERVAKQRFGRLQTLLRTLPSFRSHLKGPKRVKRLWQVWYWDVLRWIEMKLSESLWSSFAQLRGLCQPLDVGLLLPGAFLECPDTFQLPKIGPDWTTCHVPSREITCPHVQHMDAHGMC